MSAATLLADQLSKALIVRAFTPGESVPLAPPILYLTYVQNTGAAFGLLKGWHLVLIGFSIAVVIWLVRELLTQPVMSAPVRWGSALILGGAIGNLIDRARLGYVIDFLDFRVWPVFNLGDSAITVGVGLLLLEALARRRDA